MSARKRSHTAHATTVAPVGGGVVVTNVRTVSPEYVDRSVGTVDFHFGRRPREFDYRAAMGEVYQTALEAIREAYDTGRPGVIFSHGNSTSRPGQTTARSVVRGLVRSPVVTPYVDRKRSTQGESRYYVAIRPKAP
jgi:hypothetical protein